MKKLCQSKDNESKMAGGGGGGKGGQDFKAKQRSKPLPMRIRIQSTLLPTKSEQMENYQQHEVVESDSIQKLAIQYRVSVRIWLVLGGGGRQGGGGAG
eukprot:SAG22_NODE_768_length_7351_cov_27.969939_2_plen_98_part_00